MSNEQPAEPPTPVVWCVGLTTLDVIHHAATPPTRNAKVTATRQDVAAGGPAANAAVTAAALGARVTVITAIGPTATGRVARADLEAHGVTVLDCAANDPAFALAVSSVLVDEASGERSVVSPDGALTRAPGPEVSSLAALPWPDAVLFDGHHPAIVEGVLAYLGLSDDTPRRQRPLVVLDCGRWRPVFERLIPVADVAAMSADFTVPTCTNGTDAMDAVLAMGATTAVVTHGAGPVTWRDACGDGGEVAVPEVRAVDTLGAGDAFHGALTAALASEAPLPTAIVHAVVVASTRVQHVGPRAWLNHLPNVPINGDCTHGACVRKPCECSAGQSSWRRLTTTKVRLSG